MRNATLIHAAALMLLPFVAAVAQDEAKPAPDSPEKALLQRSISFVSTLPAFTTDIAMKFELADKSGATRDGELKGTLAFSGADRARFRVETEDGVMELYYGPESKLIYLTAQNQYVDGAAFGDRQKSFTVMPRREFQPAQIMFSDFLHGDPSLLQSIESIAAVKAEGEAPDAPDHLQAEGDGLTIDFWIRKGEQPFLEKFSVDLARMAAEANPDLTKALVTYTISNWNANPEFAEDYFVFVMPEGATKLDTSGNREQAENLEGNAAPAINLPLLGSEETLDLAAHKGKNVVILDFWASWCGPCRTGLPIVSELAAQYKDKGVVFYAVNVGETPEQATAFLQQTGLNLTVALDSEHDASRKYQANSIPKTVIIDKEGIVHEVHTGVSPTLKDDLTKTLATLTQ